MMNGRPYSSNARVPKLDMFAERTRHPRLGKNALYGLYMSGDNQTGEERGEDATHFWKDLTRGGGEAAIPSGPGGTPNPFNNELQRLDSTRLVRNIGIVM